MRLPGTLGFPDEEYIKPHRFYVGALGFRPAPGIVGFIWEGSSAGCYAIEVKRDNGKSLAKQFRMTLSRSPCEIHESELLVVVALIHAQTQELVSNLGGNDVTTS